jgi:hypothetical protein
VTNQTFALHLDSVSFEVRYAFGHTYLDRCGQTLVDVERNIEGWVAGDTDVQSGALANPSTGDSVRFSPERFVFTATQPREVSHLASTAAAIWGIVRLNLGLSEWVRVGARFQYLLPKSSSEDVERALLRAPMRVVLVAPSPGAGLSWPEGFIQTAQQPSATFKKDGLQYRVALMSIIRAEGVSASSLIATNPRLLSKNRRQARLDAIKARQNYERNPSFAIHLDVDCFAEDPEEVEAESFIVAQAAEAGKFRFLVDGL